MKMTSWFIWQEVPILLKRENGILSKKLIDHEMCVYVIGGTSSPSCSNYVLKRTSIDQEDQLGKAAAETLQDNFYVDDLLKSLNNEIKAIKLIRNVKAVFPQEVLS